MLLIILTQDYFLTIKA